MNTMQLEISMESPLSRRMRVYCRKAFVLGTMVTFGLALFGCGAISNGSDDSSSDSSSTEGVVVKLSDAPGKLDWFARADIVLDGVEAQINNKWVSLGGAGETINLLELRGGISRVLGRVNGTTGSIRQMRLIVSSASLTLKDGRVFPLKIPSGEQSGLKVFVEPAIELVTGRMVELMLDFDVAKSFVAQGNPASMADAKGFLFKPVIRVGNSTIHGGIAGLVLSDSCTPGDSSDDLPVNNATVDVINGDGEIVTSNSTIATGQFAVYGLDEGSYGVAVSAAGYSGSQRDGVLVYRGNMSEAGIFTLGKNDCGGGGDTETGTSTEVETNTDTNTATETSTETSAGTETNTATETSTETETNTDAGTDTNTDTNTGGEDEGIVPPWSVFGFDATTQETAIAAIWRTEVPTVAVLRLGLSDTDFSVAQVVVHEPATEQIVGVQGLMPDTVYYLQVTAIDENGVSRQSVVIMKRTKALP